jgi:hypothetical protein
MIKESYYLATRQFNPFYSPSRTLLKTEDEIIDFVKNNLSGSGRWLFYCLERYWDLYK